jgi:hypothetical protein
VAKMRDFKNPTYDGPDCVCCKSKATEERERIIALLEELIKERSGVNLQGAISLIKGDSK